MFAILSLMELAIVGLVLLVAGWLLVRYVPPVRRAWQRFNGRHLEEVAQYFCKDHGDIDPLEAVRTTTGRVTCPYCYSTLLKQEFSDDA